MLLSRGAFVRWVIACFTERKFSTRMGAGHYRSCDDVDLVGRGKTHHRPGLRCLWRLPGRHPQILIQLPSEALPFRVGLLPHATV
jgi:hypothetical protein